MSPDPVELERAFHALFEGAFDAMLIAGDDGRYLEANAAACGLLGLSRDRIVGRGTWEFSPGIDEAAFRLVWDRFLADGKQRGEYELRRADGDSRWIEFSATAHIRPGWHLSVIRDVTDRRRARDDLNRSAGNFQALMELAPDGITLYREDRLLYANPAAVTMFRWSLRDLRRMRRSELAVPEEREKVARATNGLEVGRTISLEWSCRRGDGTIGTIESSVLCFVLDEEETILSYCRDVTERKEMQSRLMIADRMVSVGTLAAGVAHEINNPLSFVVGNLTLLDEAVQRIAPSVPPDEADEIRQCIDDARVGGERIRQIVHDLKTLSRGDDERRIEIDVRRVLDSCAAMAKNEIRHRATLTREYAEDLPLVLANDAKLAQVFLNLIVNAAQAIPDGKAHENRITLRARASGGQVFVDVRDTGTGIAPMEQKRIFDAFYTTKPVGVGTGLGLPICQRIVTGLGGELRVDSRVGHGSTFTVVLPACGVTASRATRANLRSV